MMMVPKAVTRALALISPPIMSRREANIEHVHLTADGLDYRCAAGAEASTAQGPHRQRCRGDSDRTATIVNVSARPNNRGVFDSAVVRPPEGPPIAPRDLDDPSNDPGPSPDPNATSLSVARS